jgi:hypothetical protein
VAQGRLRWWNVVDGIGGERVTDLAVDAHTLWVGFGEDGFSRSHWPIFARKRLGRQKDVC